MRPGQSAARLTATGLLVLSVGLAACGGSSDQSQIRRAVAGFFAGGANDCNYVTPAEAVRHGGSVAKCRAIFASAPPEEIVGDQQIRVSGTRATDEFSTKTDHYRATLVKVHGKWLVDTSYGDKEDIAAAIKGLYGTPARATTTAGHRLR